jgi:Protein similar to CwfJ C-terminus 1
LAKGGLTPDHVLILPIFHLRSYPELDEDAATELQKYKKALMKFFADQDKSTVFFERNFKSKHMQLQVVPIPRSDPEKVKQLFLERAEESQLKLTEIPSRSDVRQVYPSHCRAAVV